jgi:2-polyprenyl-3-methyl-5-hydroxy-6-metoxy-1,4-benzoquinol methylase
MKKNANALSHFSENAESWILDAYESTGYNYPVGYHRLRIVKKILSELSSVKKLIDVGCGGGQLLCSLAEKGFSVYGIDQSQTMIDLSAKNINALSPEIASRVSLKLGSLGDNDFPFFDAVTAMGFIGYLPQDRDLFEFGNKVLEKNGYIISSVRNPLFNLFSGSNQISDDIEKGVFQEYLSEIAEIKKNTDPIQTEAILSALKKIIGDLFSDGSLNESANTYISPSHEKGMNYTSTINPRQTSPKQLRIVADECGYNTLKLYGVHPHFHLPFLNKLMPPQVYNKLSDALIPMEESPYSLLWSSVFIGVFQRR